MIVSFTGFMGGGKTLSMIRHVKKYADAGFTIYSNIHLEFKYIPLTLKNLLDYAKSDEAFKKCVMIIDEAHIFLDSRRSVSAKNVILSYFLTQTRKKDVKLFITTQHFHQVEKRLRDNTDVLVKCKSKKVGKGDDEKVYVRNVWVSHAGNKTETFLANPYYQYYNTYEVVGFGND